MAIVQCTVFHQTAQAISRAAALAILGVILCTAAHAQTAHVSWAQSKLNASFTFPSAVAVDSSGNVYITDFYGGVYEIMAVNGAIPASPVINTLGGGFSAPTYIALDGNANVYITDNGANHAIEEIPQGCGSSACVRTLTTAATNPSGIAVDGSGDVYFSDDGDGVVAPTVNEIVAVGGSIPASPTIHTLTTSVVAPCGLKLDASGDLYVADPGAKTIVEIVAVNGSMPASPNVNVVLSSSVGAYPYDIVLDGSGNLYFANGANNSITKIAAAGGGLTDLGAGFGGPSGLAIDAGGNIYVVDSGIYPAIDELSFSGGNFGATNVGAQGAAMTIGFTFDTAGSGVAPAVYTQGVIDLDYVDAGMGSCTLNGTTKSYAAGDQCTVVVNFSPRLTGPRYGAASLLNVSEAAIATFNLQGAGLGPQVAFPSSTPIPFGGAFNYPKDAVADASGNVYVADSNNHAVKEILAVDGVIPPAPAINTLGAFNQPAGLAVDGSGNIYVASDGEVNEIMAVNGAMPAIPVIRTLGSGFTSPWGVAVDGKGNVYVADTDVGTVSEMLAVNGVIPASPTISILASGFAAPTGIAVDSAGNVYVADPGVSLVREILAVDGVIPAVPNIRTLGSGFNEPWGLAVDGNGNVYVADLSNAAVYQILAVNGVIPAIPVINTLGSGFAAPIGVSLDGGGNIYVADYGNSRVAELPYSTAPSLSYPATAIASTSSPQTVTVENIGGVPLNFLAVGYPDIFPEASPSRDTCSTESTLAAGATCTFSVGFAPLAFGSFRDSIVLVDNSLNQTYAVQYLPVSGAGLYTQAITFTDGLPAQAFYTASLYYSLSATGGASGNPVVFSVLSGPAYVIGNQLFITGVGTVVVAADQAGSPSYAPAPEVTQSITIKTATQTISFTPITGTQYAGTQLTLSASATSTLPVTFSSGTTSVCTVAGNTLSLLIRGTCIVHAAQAGNSFYSAAQTVIQSFAVTLAPQSISFTAITGAHYATTQLTLSATATSGLAVTFSSTTTSVCSVSGSTLSLLIPGTCIVHAAQAGSTTYAAAPVLAQSFAVSLAPQTITFSPITGKQYALTQLTLAAAASSDLAVSFSSTTASICSVSGSTLSLLTPGTCIVHAAQAGDNVYAAAPTATQSFAVSLAPQTITFTPITGPQYAGTQVTLNATATSGLTVTFSSTTTSICSVSGSTLSLLTQGTCIVHAAQAGNSIYATAATAQSFAVKAAL